MSRSNRRYLQAARNPVEGAPYAQWKIKEVESPEWILEDLAPRYEDIEGDACTACVPLGAVVLVPALKEIWVYPAPCASEYDTDALFDWVKKHRNSGTFPTRDNVADYSTTTLPLVGKVHFTLRGQTFAAERCSVRGCSKFGKWHNARNLHARHIACEIRKAEYTVELWLECGEWRPKVTFENPSEPLSGFAAAGLINDLQWALAERRTITALDTKEVAA